MNYIGYECISFEKKEKGILHVKLNRPESLNSVNERLHEELARVFIDISRDRDTRVVVLTGEGRAFSAGGDINMMTSMQESSYKTLQEGYDIVRRLIEVPQIVIARLNGHAIGLGATIALYCDIIIANKNAKISDPHIQVGLVAGDGGAGIWPMVLGPAKAKQYLLTGDPLTAEDAEKLGLINEAVSPDDLDERVNYWAERFVQSPQLALQLTKRSINKELKRLVDNVVEPSLMFEGITFFSDDLQEGVSAFLEKRKPNFK